MVKRVYFVAFGGTVQGMSRLPVEGEVQGEEASVDKLLQDVGQGPSGATVVKLTQKTRDVVADEADFAVRH
ncbi:hypothetical protein HC256_002081 [Beauveria bassiana]|nr:hypothetical protein HC256_002081 [Beauveria bassiana]